MKIIDSTTLKDITATVIQDMRKADGYAYIAYLGGDNKTFIKDEDWDMAVRYADMGYTVVEIN